MCMKCTFAALDNFKRQYLIWKSTSCIQTVDILGKFWMFNCCCLWLLLVVWIFIFIFCILFCFVYSSEICRKLFYWFPVGSMEYESKGNRMHASVYTDVISHVCCLQILCVSHTENVLQGKRVFFSSSFFGAHCILRWVSWWAIWIFRLIFEC